MKNRKISLEPFIKVMILIILALSIMYCIISFVNIIPFGIKFIRGEYLADSLYPNYSSVYSSVFTLINIVITGCLSWLVYKINNEQKNNNYNINIVSPANGIYYIIKFYLLECVYNYLNNTKGIWVDEEYKNTDGEIVKASEVISKSCPNVNSDKIEEYLFKIIGNIEEPRIRHNLFAIVQDIIRKKNILYTLEAKFTTEISGKAWANLIFDISEEKWTCLNFESTEIMEELLELSKHKNN